ncbi:transposase family protein [Streptomyces avermitilis]
MVHIHGSGKIFVGRDHLGAAVSRSRVTGSIWLCSVELPSVLAHLASVLVESVDASGPCVVVRARTRSGASAGCTRCGSRSEWSHSRYVRHLADIALGGRPVRLDLSVRRLYCENTVCPKVTFAEQVPELRCDISGARRCCSPWSRQSV